MDEELNRRYIFTISLPELENPENLKGKEWTVFDRRDHRYLTIDEHAMLSDSIRMDLRDKKESLTIG